MFGGIALVCAIVSEVFDDFSPRFWNIVTPLYDFATRVGNVRGNCAHINYQVKLKDVAKVSIEICRLKAEVKYFRLLPLTTGTGDKTD